MPPSGDLAVVIPAKNESDRISATVTAAAQLPGVDFVVVVDDGSSDGTGVAATAAGAAVVRHSRSRGKAAAMETGAKAVAAMEARHAEDGGAVGPVARHLLFLDADLASTAAQAGPLTVPVREGLADMTIAVFSKRVRKGGHGFVVALSGGGIERATGWRPAEPLNGQRCLTRAAFEAALPLAPGWGAETGMTLDPLRGGQPGTRGEGGGPGGGGRGGADQLGAVVTGRGLRSAAAPAEPHRVRASSLLAAPAASARAGRVPPSAGRTAWSGYRGTGPPASRQAALGPP